MASSSFLKMLLRLFGIRESENEQQIKKFTALIAKAEEQIRAENNRLNGHKYDIRDMEASIAQREKEWRAETSQNLHRILGRELEVMITRLNLWRDIENIIFRNIQCWGLIEARARSLKTAYSSDVVNTDVIDDLLDSISEIRGEQKDLSRAETKLREQSVSVETEAQGVDDEIERLIAEHNGVALPKKAPVETAPAETVPVETAPVVKTAPVVETVPVTPARVDNTVLEE